MDVSCSPRNVGIDISRTYIVAPVERNFPRWCILVLLVEWIFVPEKCSTSNVEMKCWDEEIQCCSCCRIWSEVGDCHGCMSAKLLASSPEDFHSTITHWSKYDIAWHVSVSSKFWQCRIYNGSLQCFALRICECGYWWTSPNCWIISHFQYYDHISSVKFCSIDGSSYIHCFSLQPLIYVFLAFWHPWFGWAYCSCVLVWQFLFFRSNVHLSLDWWNCSGDGTNVIPSLMTVCIMIGCNDWYSAFCWW